MAAVGEAVTLLKELREEGISLLGVRAAAILNYVTDLGLVLRAKSGGRSLREEPALPRILESRVVLEKLRPLEQRIRYQVDKLIRADGTTGLSQNPTF
ncbi:neuroguidin isoform X2 [Coturnix japonica]|uniref:neuroguidin isoform X2 n=1 Tax=Coturnix japonica TaxID=93934 RepID=UPI000777CA93|nr:neuroguidin isoform X2 [Coturnix japonica]